MRSRTLGTVFARARIRSRAIPAPGVKPSSQAVHWLGFVTIRSQVSRFGTARATLQADVAFNAIS